MNPKADPSKRLYEPARNPVSASLAQLRLFQALSLIALAISATLFSINAIAADRSKLLVLGDSLSAGYGIDVDEGWVYKLGQTLGSDYQVINASISGETTGGGLRNIDALLEKHQPGYVLIELGANDGLRGFPLKVIEKNLSTLIEKSQNSGAEVVLVGIHIPPNYGKAYALAFHKIYEKLADKFNTARIPFLLEGVATKPELMQKDGLHPKADAQKIILQTVLQTVRPLIEQNEK